MHFPPCFPLLVAGGALGAYGVYLAAGYRRLPACQPLSVTNNSGQLLPAHQLMSAVSYNLGFGAYSPDFSFFLSGGRDSVAKSRDAVLQNTAGAIRLLQNIQPDFVLAQEVDRNSTRSHHVDQYAMLAKAFPDYGRIFAINFDSPFLAWPPMHPHGKSLAGLAAFSRWKIERADRRSLPVASGPARLVDLDRCYSVQYIPLKNKKQLVIYHAHLSAYGGTPAVLDAQVTQLFSDLRQQFHAGNYCLCGGDFNQRLMGDTNTTGAREFPFHLLPPEIRYAAKNGQGFTPTVRDSAAPYRPGISRTAVIDGFFVSSNIMIQSVQTIDTGFLYSDHNPVVIQFYFQTN